MVTGLSFAVFGLGIALAVFWRDLVVTRKELESLWGRTRDLHNMMGGLTSKHESTSGELKKVKEFTLRLQKDIHG